MAAGHPFCIRLTPDLLAAVQQLAQNEQVSPSEWARNLIYRTVYGEPLGIDEGYHHGKQAAFTATLAVVQAALQQAMSELPERFNGILTGTALAREATHDKG